MKVATWNVNGIRAREAQLCDWLERDQPDVVCLQEIKARPDQVPERCRLADYHAFWHGAGGYSGVSLHLRRELLEVPEFSHPEFDMETRIVQVTLENLVLASVYVPNGGKDYTAKLAFLTALAAWTKQLHDDGVRSNNFSRRRLSLLHFDPIVQLAVFVRVDLGRIRLDHRLDRLGLGEHADDQSVARVADTDVVDADHGRALRAVLLLRRPGTLLDRRGLVARRRVVALQHAFREIGEARVLLHGCNLLDRFFGGLGRLLRG